MEQEMLYQIRQITDMLNQLEEQTRKSLPVELDAEVQNAILGLFQAMDKYRWCFAFTPMPSGPSGSSGGGVQTKCPKCGNAVTVTLK
jgi:hypothetical protein